MLTNVLEVGDGSGWGAKDIGDAATTLGKSNIAVGILILAGIYLFGRYVAKPYFDSRRKGGDS